MYYNSPFALVGSSIPRSGALLSTQSIACHNRSRCSARRAETSLAAAVHREISAFLLTDPRSAVTPPGCTPPRSPDGDDYVLSGVKLWTCGDVSPSHW